VRDQELWWFTDPSIAFLLNTYVEFGPVLPEGAQVSAVTIEFSGRTCPNRYSVGLSIRLVSVGAQTYAQVEDGESILPFRTVGNRFRWLAVIDEAMVWWDLHKTVGGANRRLAVGRIAVLPCTAHFRVGIRYTIK